MKAIGLRGFRCLLGAPLVGMARKGVCMSEEERESHEKSSSATSPSSTQSAGDCASVTDDAVRVEAQGSAEGCCPLEGEGLVPKYYVQCGYCWPEFFDKGCFIYSEVRFCSFKLLLDCTTIDEARLVANRMNRDGVTCPVCGQKGKFKATTDYDMFNERRIIDGIINNAVNGR